MEVVSSVSQGHRDRMVSKRTVDRVVLHIGHANVQGGLLKKVSQLEIVETEKLDILNYVETKLR